VSRSASWQGDPCTGERFAAWRARGGERHAKVLHRGPRRRVLAWEEPGAPPRVAKAWAPVGPAARLRVAWRRGLGRDPAGAEWWAADRLRGRRVGPETLGIARDGARSWLVQERLSGRPLADALAIAEPVAAARLLDRLGACVRRLHAAGVRHGDLHHGNVIVGDGEPRLVDFQGARRLRGRRDREAEVAFLDASLADLLPRGARRRVVRAALGLAPPFDAAARASLRRVAARSLAVRRARAVRRTRRIARPGQEAVRVELGDWRGLRLRSLPPARVGDALAAHHRALSRGEAWKDDGRSAITGPTLAGQRLVVKQVPARGWRRAVADRLRGSPGRRAWRAGHGLTLRGVGAARPVAVLERCRLGLPVDSLVVLEDLGGGHQSLEALARAGALTPQDADAVMDAVAHMHALGVDHGDLKSSHLFLQRGPAGVEVRCIDLEGVRLGRRPTERRRRRALVQLNGSLGDELPVALRERAFRRYQRRQPFADPVAARRRILAESVARGDVFRGRGCAEGPRSGRPG